MKAAATKLLEKAIGIDVEKRYADKEKCAKIKRKVVEIKSLAIETVEVAKKKRIEI